MNKDEFRNALRGLINDAVKSGLDIDVILIVADEELHPDFDCGDVTEPVRMDR
jgi:hypothetical protein